MHRPERIAETLREEIAQIVGYELEDPRLAMITVTEVRVADDLRDASVYVTVRGTSENTTWPCARCVTPRLTCAGNLASRSICGILPRFTSCATQSKKKLSASMRYWERLGRKGK